MSYQCFLIHPATRPSLVVDRNYNRELVANGCTWGIHSCWRTHFFGLKPISHNRANFCKRMGSRTNFRHVSNTNHDVKSNPFETLAINLIVYEIIGKDFGHLPCCFIEKCLRMKIILLDYLTHSFHSGGWSIGGYWHKSTKYYGDDTRIEKPRLCLCHQSLIWEDQRPRS